MKIRRIQNTISLRGKARGSVFFTMTIFIMMLASTLLMYYYFQRTRLLEQELTSIRGTRDSDTLTGTVKVGESRYKLASWDREDKPVTVAKPGIATQPDDVPSQIERTPSTPSDGAVSATLSSKSSSPATEKEFTAEQRRPEESKVESPTPVLAEVDPIETPNSALSTHEQYTPAAPAPGSIHSIYDVQNTAPTDPPRVRVRSPQRDR